MTDRILWSPNWAKHVEGWHEERRVDEETGQAEETPWGAKCTICGIEVKGMCGSGHFKQRIATFALVHFHKDPLTGERR